MTHKDRGNDLGLRLSPGSEHYRAYVGPPADYDLVAAMSFGLLTVLGLRQQHRILDIGCGSLRVGRLLIPYLNRGGYCGLDPNGWLIEEGIEREIGRDLVAIKRPELLVSADAGPLISKGQRYDYILAQSIFSHCGPDLLHAWLDQVAVLLAPGGMLAATFVPGPDDTSSGWKYPDCVTYEDASILAASQSHGLKARVLDWYHPRQTWFVAGNSDAPIECIPASGLSWNSAFAFLDGRAQHETPSEPCPDQ